MRAVLCILVILALGGCASATKIESGERTIGQRMVVQLEGSWNHITGPNMGPAQTWTMEGLPIDQLLIYSGLKDGEAAHGASPTGSSKVFNFRSTMQPDEVVSMFEGILTRDGSTFKLAKMEPSGFGGLKGFRFEYLVTRKVDNVQLNGVGYAAISNGELFAMLYAAPKLTFFDRHKARVEQMARSARVKA